MAVNVVLVAAVAAVVAVVGLAVVAFAVSRLWGRLFDLYERERRRRAVAQGQRLDVAVPTGAAPSLPREMRNAMVAVEAVLRRPPACTSATLQVALEHVVLGAGKRIRPQLALAGASLGWRRRALPGSAIAAAASIELLHGASLVHDDVIDAAPTRRGRPTVNARWDDAVAIVVGDFIAAWSAEVATDLNSNQAGLMAAAWAALADGELAESEMRYRTDRTVTHYFTTIDNKTASLMAAACVIGTADGKVRVRDVRNMFEFGRHFGLAFQLADDLLDVLGIVTDTGKEPNQDLRCGIYALPVLTAMHFDENLASRLGTDDPAELESIRATVADSPGVDVTWRLLLEQRASARAAVSRVRARVATRDALTGLLDWAIQPALDAASSHRGERNLASSKHSGAPHRSRRCPHGRSDRSSLSVSATIGS